MVGDKHQKWVYSPWERSLFDVLRILCWNHDNPAAVKDVRRRSMRGVGGCKKKKSSHVILNYLRDKGANFLGSGPEEMREITFNTPGRYFKWACYFKEVSLCPVCYIGEGELMRGASGKFYFNVYGNIYALGNTEEKVAVHFVGDENLRTLKTRSIYDLEEQYNSELKDRLQQKREQMASRMKAVLSKVKKNFDSAVGYTMAAREFVEFSKQVNYYSMNYLLNWGLGFKKLHRSVSLSHVDPHQLIRLLTVSARSATEACGAGVRV